MKLPENLREQLKTPLGDLIKEEYVCKEKILSKISSESIVITVGDKTTEKIIHFGIIEISSSGDAELSIHSPLEIIATVSNSGVAAENVSLDCTLNNGSDARISPAYPILNVPASGTQTVSFTWRGTSEGTKSLNCVIVKPNDWLSSGVWDNDGANSDDVTWLALVDADEGSGIVIILLAAMAVGIVLAITIAMRQQQEELGEETTEEDDVKDYDDVDSEIEDKIMIVVKGPYEGIQTRLKTSSSLFDDIIGVFKSISMSSASLSVV